MFCGSYEHTLDEKNRLVIPAQFRTWIRSEEDREGFFIFVSPARNEKCLRLYTPSGWRRQASAIRREAMKAENPSEFYRFMTSHAEFVPVDTQGRMVLPRKWLAAAGLEHTVLFRGVDQWFEVWDPEEYARHFENSQKKYSANVPTSLMPDEPAKES